MAAAALDQETATTAGRPWLSVLVPLLSLEQPVLRCLDSLTAQLCAGVEIIVLDTVCNDASWHLLSRHHGRWSGLFKVAEHGSCTRNQARNRLLRLASGRFVWWLDAHDQLLPGALAGLETILRDHRPDVVLCDSLVNYPSWCTVPPGYRRRTHFKGQQNRLVRSKSQWMERILAPRTLYLQVTIARRALWDAECLRFSHRNPHCELAQIPRLGLRAASHYYTPSVWVEHRHWPSRPPLPGDPEKLSRVLQPFTVEVRRRCGRLRPSTRFMISHACGRIFVQAISSLVESGYPWSRQQLLQLRDDFRRNSFMDIPELVAQYNERNRPWFPQELLYWMNFVNGLDADGHRQPAGADGPQAQPQTTTSAKLAAAGWPGDTTALSSRSS